MKPEAASFMLLLRPFIHHTLLQNWPSEYHSGVLVQHIDSLAEAEVEAIWAPGPGSASLGDTLSSDRYTRRAETTDSSVSMETFLSLSSCLLAPGGNSQLSRRPGNREKA